MRMWEAKGPREGGMREWDGICQISDRIRGGAQARKFHTCHAVEMRVGQGILCKEEWGLESSRSQDCRCRMRLNWNIEVVWQRRGQKWSRREGKKRFYWWRQLAWWLCLCQAPVGASSEDAPGWGVSRMDPTVMERERDEWCRTVRQEEMNDCIKSRDSLRLPQWRNILGNWQELSQSSRYC